MSSDPDSNRNAGTIAGLREVADWLERHDDVPPMAVLVHGTIVRGDARAQLARFAELLDCRASERAEYGYVKVCGEFAGEEPGNRVNVELQATVGSVGGRQAVPTYEYDPILTPCRACDGTGHGPPDGPDGKSWSCDSCEGAGQELASSVGGLS